MTNNQDTLIVSNYTLYLLVIALTSSLSRLPYYTSTLSFPKGDNANAVKQQP